MRAAPTIVVRCVAVIPLIAGAAGCFDREDPEEAVQNGPATGEGSALGQDSVADEAPRPTAQSSAPVERPIVVRFESEDPSSKLISLHAIREQRARTDAPPPGVPPRIERRRGLMLQDIERYFDGENPLAEHQLEAFDALSGALALGDPVLQSLADSNADGLVQDGEWGPLLQYLDDFAMQQREQMLRQYDADGNGRYSPEEAAIAERELGSLLDAVDQFAGIDLDFDGSLSSTEVMDYFDRHAGRDPTADLNADGRIDNADLALFVDIITR